MSLKLKKWLTNGLLLVSAVLVSVMSGELMLRKFDGYRLFTFTLIPTTDRPVAPAIETNAEQIATSFLSQSPDVPGIDNQWFRIDPAALPSRREPTAELAERYQAAVGKNLAAVYDWNYEFLRTDACASGGFFTGLTQIDHFDDGTEEKFPRYRFKRNVTYPSGLVTNDFGWRGPPIQKEKPKNTVRIAFVGASTTVNGHGLPFSYPEYAVHWLNMWANANDMPFAFEVINAGREGTNSDDFEAVVRKEIVPFAPDFVVYYEGSNQFWPVHFVRFPLGYIPPRPTVTFSTHWLSDYSAIMRRVDLALSPALEGKELHKLWLGMDWPEDLDEFDPDIDYPDLPLNLGKILNDLSSIHDAIKGIDAKLIMSSFVWLVEDGMILELPKHQNIYKYLNETFGPFPYAHMRRMADFQNRVFQKFAIINDLEFVDVASAFPMNPDLFSDAIHRNALGVRIHGWIVFLRLVDIVQKAFQAGDIPSRGGQDISNPFLYKTETSSADSLAAMCVGN